MSVNDTSSSILDDSRVILQIVVSLTDSYRGIIYIHKQPLDIEFEDCSESAQYFGRIELICQICCLYYIHITIII
jgi:hypothetical protein